MKRAVCQVGRLLRSCPDPAAGTCQYCGKLFCTGHGDFLGEGLEACHRDVCQRKVADLRQHQAYKQAVVRHNTEEQCGISGCGRGLWGQCSHCEGLFCRPHLHPRVRTVPRGRVLVREPVSLCDHCWERHQLWQRK
ncbi:MAG: hypothetical protein HYS09_01870 [Chloroflexi bacterium]|nr:hypothetical protein [Chloroflexota bacterium]